MKKALTTISFLLLVHMLCSQSQAFTSSGSFLVPTGVTTLTIEVVGAGGTGGGNGGGGGGGGGYAKGVYAVTPGSSLPVTIGIGGSGSVGGTSSVSSFLSASGGANGTSVPNPAIGGGGTGGSGTNGNIVNRTGGNGGGAYWTYFGGGGGGAGGPAANGSNGGNTIAWTGICMTPGGSGGTSGGAPGGNGGKGAGFTDVNCNITDPSAAGSTYGGGGGGANGNGGAASAGANGYCIISWGNNCVAPASPSNITTQQNMGICSGRQATLTASSSGTVGWYANPTGGTAIGTGSGYVTPVQINTNTTPVTITFYAEAITCTNSAVRTAVTVTVFPLPVITVSSSRLLICTGQQAVMSGSGSVTSYTWSPYNSSTMSFSTGLSVTLNPSVTITYTVTGTGVYGCENNAFITLPVFPTPNIFVQPSNALICPGDKVTFTASGAQNYIWSPYNAAVMTNSLGPQTTIQPSVSSVYTVTGSTSTCSNIAVISITVNALPNLTTTATSSIICPGSTVSLSAAGALIYIWNLNQVNASIVVSPTIITTYTVIGSAANSCTASAVITISVTNCTGGHHNESQHLNSVIVFPNPNKGEFNIRSTTNVEINLSNDLGQMIKTVILDDVNNRNFTLKNLRSGIYFVSFKGDNKAPVQKIVVTE